MSVSENIKQFRYKKEYLHKLLLFAAAFICGIAAICIALCSAAYGNTALWISLIMAVLFVALSVAGFMSMLKHFYRVIVCTDIEFQQMEKCNDTLLNLNKDRPFSDVLHDYLQYFSTSAEGEYSARLLQKQAELNYMQSQINPHFLYNTLDSIRGQAVNDNSFKTATMIQSLSRIFRYTISRHDDIVTLKQELENIKDYMNLQKHRFGDRFEYSIQLQEEEDEILSCKLPKLTLQPIVENAVKHGMDAISSHGYIAIQIFTTQSRLIVTVLDNGPGMDVKTLTYLNTCFENGWYDPKRVDLSGKPMGMGLFNVNARLKLLYGEDYGLTAFSAAGSGAKIQIVLPFHQQQE